MCIIIVCAFEWAEFFNHFFVIHTSNENDRNENQQFISTALNTLNTHTNNDDDDKMKKNEMFIFASYNVGVCVWMAVTCI